MAPEEPIVVEVKDEPEEEEEEETQPKKATMQPDE